MTSSVNFTIKSGRSILMLGFVLLLIIFLFFVGWRPKALIGGAYFLYMLVDFFKLKTVLKIRMDQLIIETWDGFIMKDRSVFVLSKIKKVEINQRHGEDAKFNTFLIQGHGFTEKEVTTYFEYVQLDKIHSFFLNTLKINSELIN